MFQLEPAPADPLTHTLPVFAVREVSIHKIGQYLTRPKRALKETNPIKTLHSRLRPELSRNR